MTDLVFEELRTANVRRCEDVFHPLDSWSPRRWALCVAGEAGEACNEWKKAVRGDGSLGAVLDELADVVIYSDLLAARIGIPLAGDVDRLSVIEAMAAGSRLDDVEDDLLELYGAVNDVVAVVRGATPPAHLGEIIRAAANAAAGLQGRGGLAAVVVSKFNTVSRRRNSRVFLPHRDAIGGAS